MNKYDILESKLNQIIEYIDNMVIEDTITRNFMLDVYKGYINEIIEDIKNRTLVDSRGGILGLIRGVSDYDKICKDIHFLKMLYDADKYYSEDCYTFG